MVDDTVTDASLARYQTQALDGYDLYLLEAMQKANLRQVLTDDGDFCTVPGIQVFTDRKSTRLNSSHIQKSRMPSSA